MELVWYHTYKIIQDIVNSGIYEHSPLTVIAKSLKTMKSISIFKIDAIEYNIKIE